MVCSQKPIRGKFDKDGIHITTVSYPGNVRDRSKIIQDSFGLSESFSHHLAKRIDDPQVLSIVAPQIVLSGKRRISWSQLYIPQPRDTPPWGITDAIIQGDAGRAISETTIILNSGKTTPQGLCMQLTGFFSKIVSRKNKFFSKSSRQPKDVFGMVEDMREYPPIIFSGGKTHYGVCSYAASLASRY